MNPDDLALLLALLAGGTALAALFGKHTGDAARDVRLMGATGAVLGGLAAAVRLLGA